MSQFDDIRPYNDDEVRPILDKLLADGEFLDTVARLKLRGAIGGLARLARPMVRRRLAREVSGVSSVLDFQQRVEVYLGQMLERTTSSLTCSGLDQLDAKAPHLFISNHRDIAMDPALVNWVIYHSGFSTLRIAIGDNLLTKPFASDLMRLNKSFIVRRALTNRRDKLVAAKNLSSYIHHSVLNDRENVWIAQREGRAKDGLDQTNPALINMLAMSKSKAMSFGDFIEEARIVPVAVSYEYDPCDQAKARELYEKATHGTYTKEQHEDVESIARGITGFKGHCHVAFGTPLSASYEDADQVAEEIDRQIEANYVLHPSNCLAFEMLEKRTPKVRVGEQQLAFDDTDWNAERSEFRSRLETCNEKYKPTLLTAYANPVYKRLGLK
ncbi:1-acyl-sn-glycerol-3-phosphate acyltransferase [Teredinibacter turnerae]|uniref:1-acyl-sn-glycerol-3-phosphate acyltransferase n=1 Tax=Teredinibacter turnerae TaxID=2426 RepID=UPI0003788971|nr:1-acyl-sn-glycerol-3-phosphate acyltransferase [Teredinibacter turnerae]